MVILGGLEVVAAGYLIHKHQENKRDKHRLQEEAAALEEQQYRIFPEDKHHRRRSHSRGRYSGQGRNSRERRHSHDRRHSYDRHDRKERRENSMPAQQQQMRSSHHPNMNVPAPAPIPQQMGRQAPPSMPQHLHPQTPLSMPPPQYDPATAPTHLPGDMKYGWTDGPAQQMQPQQQAQDPNYPPTGWPAHWAQSQTNLQPPRQRGESARERRGITPELSPHIRFAVPRSEQNPTPPPSYRA